MNKASCYVMFYVNFLYFEKSLRSSSDLLLDILYLVLRASIWQFLEIKFSDPVTHDGHIVTTSSIILPRFPLYVYVCFVEIFEEPLIETNQETI